MSTNSKSETGRLTADVPLTLARRVKSKAAELGKTKNEFVGEGMELYLKQLEKQQPAA